MTLTDTVLPSPDARPGQMTEVKGTVVEIAPDTIRLQVSPNDPIVAIPRILIYKVEMSLGRARAASASDAAFLGAGMSGLLIAFVPEELRLPVVATGFALGALVGALRPYEQWREAWIP